MNRRTFNKSMLNVGMMGLITSLSGLESFGRSLKEQDVKMPVLFVGHGSPMNAIEHNEFTAAWKKIAAELPVPKAIICISAHWLTKGTYITAMETPKTIHDFGGFPQELFDVQYPAKGNPTLASETKTLFSDIELGLDEEWGLDHGSWSVLKQMYPTANIPVLQLSIDYYKPAQYHYDLAKSLASLRKKGVLILGSGNMVHNLGKLSFGQSNDANFGYDWAIEINETFKKYLVERNHQALIDYQKIGKSAQLAIPTPDHYYPLLYSIALQDAKEETLLFNDKCLMGAISMTSVLIGGV